MNSSRSLVATLIGYAIPVVIVAGFVGFLAWLGSKQADVSPTGSLARDVSSDDWTIGPADAPLTLVEYSDFQCPTCAAFHPIVEQILAGYDGQIRFVYRNFPLQELHDNAVLAASAAEAAGVQGKFWEMHNQLFDEQNAWSSSSDAMTIFATYAMDLGLDVDQFTNDITSNAVKAAIQSDYQSGIASSITGTPTFFLNGTRIAELPRGYDAFKVILDAKLLELGITAEANEPVDETETTDTEEPATP